MNRVKFQIECGAVNISPAMALENDNVAKALRNDDTEELRRILREVKAVPSVQMRRRKAC